jgi:hypothetical protein
MGNLGSCPITITSDGRRSACLLNGELPSCLRTPSADATIPAFSLKDQCALPSVFEVNTTLTITVDDNQKNGVSQSAWNADPCDCHDDNPRVTLDLAAADGLTPVTKIYEPGSRFFDPCAAACDRGPDLCFKQDQGCATREDKRLSESDLMHLDKAAAWLLLNQFPADVENSLIDDGKRATGLALRPFVLAASPAKKQCGPNGTVQDASQSPGPSCATFDITIGFACTPVGEFDDNRFDDFGTVPTPTPAPGPTPTAVAVSTPTALPAVAFDGYNTFLVARLTTHTTTDFRSTWFERPENQSEMLSGDGEAFIAQAVDPIGDPSIAAGPAGNALFLWSEDGPSGARINYRRSKDHGHSWSKPGPGLVSSPDETDGLQRCDLAPVVDAGRDLPGNKGVFIAAFERRVCSASPADTEADIVVARSSRGGATFHNSRPVGKGTDPAIATDGTGGWLVLWSQQDNGRGRIAMARSLDDGKTWCTRDCDATCNIQNKPCCKCPVGALRTDCPVNFENSNTSYLPSEDPPLPTEPLAAQDKDPAVASDGIGAWIAAWRFEVEPQRSGIAVARSVSHGREWSTVQVIDPADGVGAPHVATDGTNWVVHWKQGGTATAILSRDSGRSWQAVGQSVDSASHLDQVKSDRAGLWLAAGTDQDNNPFVYALDTKPNCKPESPTPTPSSPSASPVPPVAFSCYHVDSDEGGPNPPISFGLLDRFSNSEYIDVNVHKGGDFCVPVDLNSTQSDHQPSDTNEALRSFRLDSPAPTPTPSNLIVLMQAIVGVASGDPVSPQFVLAPAKIGDPSPFPSPCASNAPPRYACWQVKRLRHLTAPIDTIVIPTPANVCRERRNPDRDAFQEFEFNGAAVSLRDRFTGREQNFQLSRATQFCSEISTLAACPTPTPGASDTARLRTMVCFSALPLEPPSTPVPPRSFEVNSLIDPSRAPFSETLTVNQLFRVCVPASVIREEAMPMPTPKPPK